MRIKQVLGSTMSHILLNLIRQDKERIQINQLFLTNRVLPTTGAGVHSALEETVEIISRLKNAKINVVEHNMGSSWLLYFIACIIKEFILKGSEIKLGKIEGYSKHVPVINASYDIFKDEDIVTQFHLIDVTIPGSFIKPEKGTNIVICRRVFNTNKENNEYYDRLVRIYPKGSYFVFPNANNYSNSKLKKLNYNTFKKIYG